MGPPPLWQQQQQQPMPQQPGGGGGGPNNLLPPLPAFGTPPNSSSLSRAPGPGAYPTPTTQGPPPSSVPGSGSRARSSFRPGLRPRCDMRLLDEKLHALARSLEPTEEEKAAQRRALEAVRVALARRWPQAAAASAGSSASRLSVFGSVASGMQVTRSNDLDLTLELDDVADDDAAGKGRAVEEAAAALDEANAEAEREAKKKEGGNNVGGDGDGDGSGSSPSSVLFDSILPLPRARVPVLKFRHVPTGTKVDVTINNRLALHNTR